MGCGLSSIWIPEKLIDVALLMDKYLECDVQQHRAATDLVYAAEAVVEAARALRKHWQDEHAHGEPALLEALSRLDPP